jgi:hypothetical protein
VEVGPLVVLGLMWLVVNAIRKAGSESSGKPRVPPRPVPGAPDATQREGARLEQLLRELGRTLDQSAGPIGRAPDRPLPQAEEVEQRDSLEGTGARQVDPHRGERPVVDQDDEAERVVARRMAAAEENAAPRTRAERAALDARIRQEPADKTATRAYTTKQLREAVVWREILGPPVSLRGEGEEQRGGGG